MEEKLYIKQLLEISKKNYEIDKYREINYYDTHIPFEGTPKKHPADKNKLVLLTDPFIPEKLFFEFLINTIDNVEEIGTISSTSGESAYRVRIWVKKGSLAIKYEPFIVE